MSDKKILDLENKKDIDKEFFVPISDKNGNNYSYDISKLATKEELEEETSNQMNPEEGQVIYTTWDNKKLQLDNSDISSHEYDENRQYGIITMKTKDSLAAKLLTHQDTLKSVKVSGSFKQLNSECLAYNKNLIEILLEPGIERLGGEGADWDNAFVMGGNTSLREIVIPDTVYVVGTACFEGSGLVSVKLPDNPKFVELSEDVFCYCHSLISIDIPDTIETIWPCAFEETPLSTISIPDSVTTIKEYAFAAMKNLSYFKFGKNVTKALTSISDCTSLKEIKIPSGYNDGWPIVVSKPTILDNECIFNRITTEKNVNLTNRTFNIYCRVFDTYINRVPNAGSDTTYFPNPLFLEELILRSETVVTGIDLYLNTSYPTKPDNTNTLPYDGKPLSKLKIYVPETLLEDYKKTYSTLAHKLFPITGEQDVYAYQDNTYTKEEVDDKLSNIDVPEADLSEIESKLEEATEDISEIKTELEEKLNLLSEQEAEEEFNEIYGMGPEAPSKPSGPSVDSSSFDLNTSYEITDIDGHSVIKAVINNHKYLIALEDAFKSKWKSASTDISSYTSYVPTSNTGGDWTFEDGLDKLLVCNFSDYYNLDNICQQILVGGSDKGINTLVHEVRKLDIGGYRWNVANFEVMWFLYENYDELLADHPIITEEGGTKNIWLPYANSATNCWKVNFPSSDRTSIKCNRNGTSYEEWVIPVALIY